MNPHAQVLHEMTRAKSFALLTELYTQPQTLSELSRRLMISKPTLHYNVQRLSEAGVVQHVHKAKYMDARFMGNKTVIALTEEGVLLWEELSDIIHRRAERREPDRVYLIK